MIVKFKVKIALIAKKKLCALRIEIHKKNELSDKLVLI